MQPAPQRDPAQTSMLAGVLYGAGAGALWGLVFLAPQLTSTFEPVLLAIGRYVAYGAISALLVAPRWRALRSALGRREWTQLAWLSLTGNVLYYMFLAEAVQAGGIAMTSLVIGFLPVVVTIVGSRERDAVPIARLVPSLLLCAAGALCIGWQTVSAPVSGSVGRQLVGLSCAVGALVSWSAFAVGNQRALARLTTITPHEWNLLTGIVTGAESLVLVPIALLVGTKRHGASEWTTFAATSVGVAVFASLLGNALWNRMSRLLPLTLVGQMILFETLFALVYGFVWDRRWPTPLEAGAFALLVASVLSCMSAHRSRPA